MIFIQFMLCFGHEHKQLCDENNSYTQLSRSKDAAMKRSVLPHYKLTYLQVRTHLILIRNQNVHIFSLLIDFIWYQIAKSPKSRELI